MNWPPEHDPQFASATPALDGWGWDTHWTIDDWMKWHMSMKAQFGLTVANQTFLKWWNQQSAFAEPLDARSFNSTFRQYARDNGFFDGLYGNLGPLAAPVAIEGAVTDAGKGINNLAGSLTWLVPVVILGAVAIYLAPIVIPKIKQAISAAKS